MRLGADAAHGIFGKDQFIAAVEGGSRRRLDANIRSDARHDDGANAATAELLVEPRAIERAPLPLEDDHIGGLEADLRNEFGGVGRNSTRRTLHGLIDRQAQSLIDFYMDEDDGDASTAERIGKRANLANNLAGRVGSGLTADHRVLQIDDDERRRFSVELSVHSQFG